MIHVRNLFDQLVKNGEGTYNNIQKIKSGQGERYLTGCLLDYPYFKMTLQDDSNRFRQTTRT